MLKERYLNRLPDHFETEEGSNIHKLLSLPATQDEEREALLTLIGAYRDLDQATGQTLDYIGRDVGQTRGFRDDEAYRKMIKIRILINLCEGDAPTVIKILQALLADHFRGLEDGWEHVVEEPASMVVNLSEWSADEWGIVRELEDQMLLAGVSLHYAVLLGMETLNVLASDYTIEIPYRICNMFRTADIYGKMSYHEFALSDENYEFKVVYPICNMFVAKDVYDNLDRKTTWYELTKQKLTWMDLQNYTWKQLQELI